MSSQSIDHLGLVAATIHELDLTKRIDNILPINKDKGVKLTMGQRVAGMIINGLGFVDTRLYMFPEFLANVAVEILIDDEVKLLVLCRKKIVLIIMQLNQATISTFFCNSISSL